MRVKPAIVFLVLVFVFILFSFPNSALAESSKSLTLSPLRTEFDIAPGTSKQGKLTIDNPSDKDLTVDLSSEAFSVINRQYDYAFDSTTELSKWVTFSDNNFSLKSGESKIVQYIVGVPISSEPGGRYISLFASTDTTNDGSIVNSRQRIGSLLYITVSGDVTRNGNLLTMSSPTFVGDSSNFSITLQNTGTTHFTSRYSVDVKNVLDGKTIKSTSNESLILPATVRTILGKIPAPKWPGLYKIEYNIGLGDMPAITKSNYIIYVNPATWIIVAIITVLTLGIFIVKKIKR